MKKKEEDEGRAVDANDSIKDEPCTKMTMRLRRNLSSAQFVSVHVPVCNRRARGFFFFASDLCPVRSLVTVRCFSAGFSSKNRTSFCTMCGCDVYRWWLEAFLWDTEQDLSCNWQTGSKKNNLQFRQVAQRFLYLVVGVV